MIKCKERVFRNNPLLQAFDQLGPGKVFATSGHASMLHTRICICLIHDLNKSCLQLKNYCKTIFLFVIVSNVPHSIILFLSFCNSDDSIRTHSSWKCCGSLSPQPSQFRYRDWIPPPHSYEQPDQLFHSPNIKWHEISDSKMHKTKIVQSFIFSE